MTDPKPFADLMAELHRAAGAVVDYIRPLKSTGGFVLHEHPGHPPFLLYVAHGVVAEMMLPCVDALNDRFYEMSKDAQPQPTR